MRKRLKLSFGGSNGIIAVAALALSLAGIGYILWPQMTYYHPAVPPQASIFTKKSSGHLPDLKTVNHISLPELGINLAVIKGSFDKESSTWTLDDKHAFYMEGAESPLVYGHDMSGIFRNLSAIRPGDALVVSDGYNHTYRFIYTDDKVVDPNDSSVLTARTNQLRLLTCTGVFYQKRRVFYFTYEPAPLAKELTS